MNRRLEVFRYFLRLGLTGFGGPSAHISMMREEIVERRRWVDERRFLDLLGAANLIPGPTSSALAIHLGYERAGLTGGLLAGIGFYFPAFAMVVALSWAYVRFGATPGRSDLLAGVRAVIPAIVLVTLWRLREGFLGRRLLPLAVAGLGLTLAFPRFAPVWIVAGGLVGLGTSGAAVACSVVPVFIAAGLVAAANLAGLPAIAWVLLRTGLLLFGGGLVLLPLLQPEVAARHWMSDRVFLDGIAIGQLTPGPVVITAAFVGYVVHGFIGATVATVAIVLPTFALVLFATGPLLERFREHRRVRQFVSAVTATALGSVAASAALLAPAAYVTPFRVAIGIGSAVALARKAPVPLVIGASAAISLVAGALR